MDFTSLSFQELLKWAIAGNADAARALYDRFEPHLRRVIRRKLSEPLRLLCESQDFLQDVWASFYAARPSPARFEAPEQLLRFLAEMATHKLADEALVRSLTRKLGDRASLELLPEADHSFHVPVRSGRTDRDTMSAALDSFASWCARVAQ